MTLPDWSPFALIVSAVLVTLAAGYLALQLREHTRLLRASIHHAATSPHSNYLGILAQDNDLARVFRTGAADYHALRSEDQLQFWALGHMILSEFERGLSLERAGALLSPGETRNVEMLRWWFAHPGFVQFWDAEKQVLGPSFVRFIETSVLDRRSKG